MKKIGRWLLKVARFFEFFLLAWFVIINWIATGGLIWGLFQGRPFTPDKSVFSVEIIFVVVAGAILGPLLFSWRFWFNRFIRRVAPRSFMDLVARSVIAEKDTLASVSAIGQLIFIILCGLPDVKAPPLLVGLFAVSAFWHVLDSVAVFHRLRSGAYGQNKIEALEAARYVTKHSRDGSGGSFNQVFEDTKQAVSRRTIRAIQAQQGSRA